MFFRKNTHGFCYVFLFNFSLQAVALWLQILFVFSPRKIEAEISKPLARTLSFGFGTFQAHLPLDLLEKGVVLLEN